MKLSSRILLSALALAIALPGAAFAAKGERKKKKGDDANQVAFETADKNKDGVVDQAEFVEAMKSKNLNETDATARFATLDKDGNGKLTTEEYNAGSAEPKKKKKKNQ